MGGASIPGGPSEEIYPNSSETKSDNWILFPIFHHKHKFSYSSNHDSEFPVVIWNGQQQKIQIVDIGQGNDIDMFMYTHDFGNVHHSMLIFETVSLLFFSGRLLFHF